MRDLRVLMLTSEWPTEEYPHYVPFLVRQVEFLQRAGIHVDVFAFRGARKLQNYARAWWNLRQLLKTTEYDLIHAQFGQSSLLPWPKRLPLVITFHGCEIQGIKTASGRPAISGLVLQQLCRLTAKKADAVIAVSERLRTFLPPSIPVSIVPLGLDLERMPRLSRHEARQKLALPAEDRLVLFVGNPEETVKRYGLAKQVVADLNSKLPATLIVGWKKSNAEILELMRACDVLLMTSIQEGSPTVVKEALACDLPVVSLDVGDVRQRVSGVAGCIVCENDEPETITAALEQVLRNPERIQGRAAVQELAEEVVTDRVIRIYRSVLTARGSSVETFNGLSCVTNSHQTSHTA